MAVMYTPSLSRHFIPNAAPPANPVFGVPVCSLQVSPFLPGLCRAEAELAINQAGQGAGSHEEHHPFYSWSC